MMKLYRENDNVLCYDDDSCESLAHVVDVDKEKPLRFKTAIEPEFRFYFQNDEHVKLFLGKIHRKVCLLSNKMPEFVTCVVLMENAPETYVITYTWRHDDGQTLAISDVDNTFKGKSYVKKIDLGGSFLKLQLCIPDSWKSRTIPMIMHGKNVLEKDVLCVESDEIVNANDIPPLILKKALDILRKDKPKKSSFIYGGVNKPRITMVK